MAALDTFLPLLGWALLGLALASVLAVFPALHAYNVAGVVMLGWANAPSWFSGEQLAYFLLGLVVGYSLVNTASGIFLSAPDEGLAFAMLPAQQYVRAGRGFEAVALIGIGGLGGAALLALLAPFLYAIFAPLRALLSAHLHWMLGCIVLYMLLSEWPFSNGAGSEWQRFQRAWGQLLAGLLCFGLSGMVGLVLFNRSLLPPERASQNLLPVFVGMFALPALLQTACFGEPLPKQHIPKFLAVDWNLIARGVAAGALGGLFAAFFPLVTAGMGGLLAGHATAQRDERIFLVSQGASKFLYYVGAYLFFFVPGLQLVRGGLGMLLASVYTSPTPDRYWLALACLLLCSGLGFLALLGWGQVLARVADRLPYRQLAWGTALLLLCLIAGLTSWVGVGVALVCTAIGSIPLYWKSRRMHCLGVVLLPVILNMAGLSQPLTKLLGL